MAWQDTLEQLQSVDLGELDFNNMGSWPGAVKGIVMTLLCAAVVGNTPCRVGSWYLFRVMQLRDVYSA